MFAHDNVELSSVEDPFGADDTRGACKLQLPLASILKTLIFRILSDLVSDISVYRGAIPKSLFIPSVTYQTWILSLFDASD